MTADQQIRGDVVSRQRQKHVEDLGNDGRDKATLWSTKARNTSVEAQVQEGFGGPVVKIPIDDTLPLVKSTTGQETLINLAPSEGRVPGAKHCITRYLHR